LQHQQDFLQLNGALRHFINGCSNGSIKLEQLIKTEADSVKEYTANEHDKTRVQINDHVDEEHRNTREHGETRNLVSGHLGRLRIEDNEEHAKTRSHVDQHIQNLQASTLSASVRDKFLKSLNFQGRDQRFNDVKEAHYKTFQWLFDEANSPDSYLQDDESEESDDDASSYQSGDSKGLLDESQELDLVYEDLVEEFRGKIMNSFSDWLKSKGVLYWIKAKAGAGKSTLMKFLCNDPRTVQLLDSSTSGKTLVLTHFFYLIGSRMQCNIKGLLCTLLYQLLQQDEDGTWMAELFRRNPSLKNKESDSNWSEPELKKALSMTLHLTTASHQICIFLDGLDEVHQSDGKHKLLNILEWLKVIGAVRLCISSRPEEEFNQALSSAWILNLHDLTAADMYQYARDLLAPLTTNFSGSVPHVEAYSRAFKRTYFTTTPQTLAKTIISKSDGVFLWADIATRSLQRGITYGDTWSTMQQRLDLMPLGLSELYASMWSRPGEDTRLYRAEAALCFNLVLDWELCSSPTSYACWNPKHPPVSRASAAISSPLCRLVFREHAPPPGPVIPLFQLTLAKHKLLRADISFGPESAVNFLWNECLQFYKRLPVLCAGLLETENSLSCVDDVGYEIRNPDIQVRFIHRTAKEFFTDTTEGREILSSDTSSLEKRLSALLRASYSRGLAFRSSGIGQREVFCLPWAKLYPTGLATRFCGSLRSRLGRKEWLEELGAFQEFHDHGAPLSTLDPDFLGLSIQYGYKEYMEHAFNDPSRYTPEYKSYLLACCIIPHGMITFIPAEGNRGFFQDAVHWSIQDLTRSLEIVNHLLCQGCKSELAIVVDPSYSYKLTGLELFLWNLSTFRRRINWNDDPLPCDLIIETLRHFSESGADFMQPVYGYYGREGLFTTSHPYGNTPILLGPGSRGEQKGFTSSRQVVVEWSILGALTWAVKTLHRDDYFRRHLQEFLATIRIDTNSLNPRIIAVRHQYNPDGHREVPCGWMEKAKRVSSRHEERLMNNISQWISQDDKDGAAKMEKLDYELDEIIISILDDGDVSEGVFGYFLELGFAESWPRFLTRELQEMGFTKRGHEDGSWRFPDGIIYPPVKFVDQLK
jgi:hypothetical protein